MSDYWCERALVGDAIASGVTLDVRDGRIASLRTNSAPPDGAVRLPGFTMPGLANGHSHVFHRALRGRTQQARGSFWTWRDQMYDVAATLDPDRYYAIARATYGEMVLAGYTAVGEFHYLHNDADGNPYSGVVMEHALAAAAAEAGIRLTLLDTCYLHGGFGRALAPVQRRFSDGSVDQWADRAAEVQRAMPDGVLVGAAIHSVRAVAPTEMTVVVGWAAERGAPLHAHVSEQPAENAECLATYGVTPTQLLANAGALDQLFTAVHATHLSDSDIAALGAASAVCCLCPTTERDLADGVGPGRRLHESGALLAIGSDSHAVVDPFEELRAIELDERLITGRRGHHRSAELVLGACVSGMVALGREETRLAADAPADFVTVALDSVRLAGTREADTLDAVVYSATASDVRHVVIGGEVVVRDGAHTRFDVPAALSQALA